jgi:hypothetical protein
MPLVHPHTESSKLATFSVVMRALRHSTRTSFDLDSTLFIPRMIGIIRPTKYITALAHPVLLTELFGARLLIVMRRA